MIFESVDFHFTSYNATISNLPGAASFATWYISSSSSFSLPDLIFIVQNLYLVVDVLDQDDE